MRPELSFRRHSRGTHGRNRRRFHILFESLFCLDNGEYLKEHESLLLIFTELLVRETLREILV